MLGLLIGIGRRAGTALRPVNATAYTLLGTRADGVWGFDLVVTLVGVVVVLVVSATAGMIVARLSPSFRTFRVFVAAAGVAFVGYLLHVHLVARVDGGLSALLSIGELRALYVSWQRAHWCWACALPFHQARARVRARAVRAPALRSRFGTRAGHARDSAARNFGRIDRGSIWEGRRVARADGSSTWTYSS